MKVPVDDRTLGSLGTRIAQLEADNAKLRKALKRIAYIAHGLQCEMLDAGGPRKLHLADVYQFEKEAADALAEGGAE